MSHTHKQSPRQLNLFPAYAREISPADRPAISAKLRTNSRSSVSVIRDGENAVEAKSPRDLTSPPITARDDDDDARERSVGNQGVARDKSNASERSDRVGRRRYIAAFSRVT